MSTSRGLILTKSGGSDSTRVDELDANLQQGEDLYRQKKYTQALRCFDTLVDEYVDPPLVLFDVRAATLDKLERPHKALRDGQHMIRTARSDPRGYLRTAQILVRMGKEDKALEIYNSGIQYVTKGSRGAKMLHDLSNKLTLRLAPSKATDPLTQLPTEVAYRVLDYLKFKEIVCICRVSKGWNQFITSDPTFWKRLEFATHRKFIPPAALKKYFKCSSGQTTHLTITGKLSFAPFAPALMQYCRRLQYLELSIALDVAVGVASLVLGGMDVTTLICGSEVKVAAIDIWTILKGCKNLRNLELLGLTQDPARGRVEEKETDNAIIAEFPQLRSLCLSSAVSSPRTFSLSTVQLGGWLPLQHDLEGLELVRLGGSRRNEIEPLRLQKLTKLQRVRYEDCTFLSLSLPPSVTEYTGGYAEHDSRNVFLEDGLPSLRSLEITGSPSYATVLDLFVQYLRPGSLEELIMRPNLGDHTWRQLLDGGFLDNLRTLEAWHGLVRDDELVTIAARCSKLTRLRVTCCNHVTGVGLKAMLQKEGTELQELDIRDCPNVGRDAIVFALGRGVKVSWGSQPIPKGRTVRYWHGL